MSLIHERRSGYDHLFAAISRAGISLTYDEIESEGARLDTLRPGTWFATILSNEANNGVEVMTGRLVYPGIGSCLVELDRGWQNLVRWCPECKVLPIPTPERAQFLPLVPADVEAQIQSIEERPMSTQQVAIALRKRYNFWKDKLAASDSEDAVQRATDTLTRIEAEAADKGVDLNASDSVKTVQANATVVQSTTTAGTKVKKGAKSIQGKEQVSEKQAALAEGAGTRVPGATRVKKEKVLRPCLDGCGTPVPGNFQMGHDAKLKSLILKVEKGEAVQADIPEIVQGIVKFKKGDIEEIRNKEGKVTEKIQLMICTAAPVRFHGRPEITLTEREAA